MSARPASLGLDVVAPPRGASTRRRVIGHAAGLAAYLALALLALVCLGWVTGHRTLIDRSDSMRPALQAGDLVINRRVAADQIARGEIVTFEDPQLRRNITHRVVERREAGGRVAFATRGDANSGVERWSAGPQERIGRLVASIPRLGFALGLVTSPLVRLLLTAVCAVGLCTLALRWIWRVQ